MEVYLGVLILIAVAGQRFAPTLIRNTVKAIDAVPVLLDGLSTGDIAGEIGNRYGWGEQQTERVRIVLVRHRNSFEGLQSWIDGSISQVAQIVGWLTLVPIVAIFLLREGNRIIEVAIKTFVPEKQRQRAETIALEIHSMLATYIRAQVFVSFLSWAFYMFVLLLFRFPHPVVLSILGGVLEFIPVFGWMSTAAVIVGVGMANGLHWLWVGGLLLVWRVTQDYFNVPHALGRGLELHPLTIIFAVLTGAEIGGIVGIFLAVPVTASLILICRQCKQRWNLVSLASSSNCADGLPAICQRLVHRRRAQTDDAVLEVPKHDVASMNSASNAMDNTDSVGARQLSHNRRIVN